MNDYEDDFYDDDLEPDPCDCMEADVDILTGRAHCHVCGRAWTMTSAELKREAEFQDSVAEAWAEEMAAETQKSPADHEGQRGGL